MERVLVAETAVLVHLKSVGIVFLVLLGLVVSLLALAARQGDLYSHVGTSCLFFGHAPVCGIAAVPPSPNGGFAPKE